MDTRGSLGQEAAKVMTKPMPQILMYFCLFVEKIENALKFLILDTGTGVEEQELPHLFEKFFRGKKAKKGGTGLGLSICKGIIEAHGGTISAKNRNPQGLCVEFILPLIPQGTPNP